MFKSNQAQGSFGEMAYELFLRKKNIKFERVNDKATDFIIQVSNVKVRIDVKCSRSTKICYNKNKNVKQLKIKYDVVFLNAKNNSVTLYPDKESPFYEKYSGYYLGKVDDLKE